MKAIYPVSNKVHASFGWHKHLTKDGKRRANKSTRRLLKGSI
jgi:hypothetical protein